MKSNLPPKVVGSRGITLIELTVVIVIVLTLIAIMFIGSQAWKRGSDRSACVLNLRSMQMATRSYQNLHGYYYGGQPVMEYGTYDIATHLLAKEFISQELYDKAKGSHPCAGGGTYRADTPGLFPNVGELYMNCSLSETQDHQPDQSTASGW